MGRAKRLISATVAALLTTALALQSQAAAPTRPTPASDEFHFVVLGDSQLHDPAAFNRIIDHVRLLQPAFVVQVGDMIEGYSNSVEQVRAEWARFKRQIAPLAPVPFVPVPGNHDLYNAERRADVELESLYRSLWGDTYQAFSYRNARFLVLNTDVPGAERRIAGAQRQWLTSELERRREAHVFVFMHRPPDSLEDADALHELFKRHAVSYVFYGHHHHYHHDQRDGVRYVMTNAAANSALEGDAAGGFDHLLVVSVRDEQLSMAVVRADGVLSPEIVHPEDNYDLFALERGLAPQSVVLTALAEGSFELPIALTNPTGRAVTLYVTCDSADGRWQFAPPALEPIHLDPGAERTLALRASYRADRFPEAAPVCTIRVPFLKRNGRWIEHVVSVTGKRSGGA